MTLDQLCGMSAAELKAISDKDYLEWFEKEGFLNVTRPERIIRQEHKQETKKEVVSYFSPAKQLAFAKLREQGVDIDAILKRKRK